MFLARNKLVNTSTVKPVVVTAKRSFQPKSWPQIDDTYKGEIPKRIGYEAHHHTKGLLPRLSLKEKRLDTMPITMKECEWSKRRATMGQNDFIKILSDQDIEQHDLLTHIPDWLRGYKNTQHEYSTLMLKRKEFGHWKKSKPLKWLHLEQRIKFLYRRLNNKYKPPEVQLLERSRHRL